MSRPTSRADRTFPKFAAVGVLNTVAGLLVIYGAKYFLAMGDIPANVTGYACGFLLSYTLNSRWTFRYTGSSVQGLLRFLLVILLAYFSNLALVLHLIDNLQVNSYLAQGLGIIPYMLVTYLLSKYFVFRQVQGGKAGAS